MKLGLSVDEVLHTTRAVRKRMDFDKPVEREVLLECRMQPCSHLRDPTAKHGNGSS